MKPNRVLKLLACLAVLAVGIGRAPAVAPPPIQYNTNLAELASWSFDIPGFTNSVGCGPTTVTNVYPVAGGDTGFLQVDSTTAALIRCGLVENGVTNLTIGTGSLLFFFAPDWTSVSAGGNGPGAPATLIQVGQYTTNASYGYWCLCIDPQGNNVCFIAQTNNGTQITYLTAPIAWTNGDWHEIALAYSATNSALYLDGVVATNGAAVTCLPGPNVTAQGFGIGSDTNGLEQAHGLFGDLSTCNYPLSAAEISGSFTLYEVFYPGLPAAQLRVETASAPSQPGTNALGLWNAVTGPGLLTSNGPAGLCLTGGNPWLTNVIAKVGNGAVNVSFTVEGGTNGVAYDVFGTSMLAPESITNAQWYWLGQADTCSEYTLTNLTDQELFLVLGTPQDSDGDGLTDAYEMLVSKTDPYNPDSNGSGLLDGWYVAYSLSPTVDPYSLCPSGDGCTILQACQNGWNPSRYYTPPPPQNVVASLSSDGASVVLSWSSGGGPVSLYLIQAGTPNAGVVLDQVGSNVFSATEALHGATYFVTAQFTNGSQAASQVVTPYPPAVDCNIAVVRGTSGVPCLVLGPMPSDLALVTLDSMPFGKSIVK